MQIVLKIGKNEEILLRDATDSFEICWPKNRKDKATGEVIQTWEPQKYFSSLVGALDSILRMKVQRSEATTLKELQDNIKQFREELIYCYGTDLQL